MGVVASISDRVGDLGAYLREQRETAKLSVRQLASLTGVSNPYLSQVERGLRRPSAEVLQQLAKGLRISAEALYVRAGILDDGPRGTVEVAIETDEGLTARQKKVLLELCAHFRSENARAETTPDDASPGAPIGAPIDSVPASTATKARTRTAGRTAQTSATTTTPEAVTGARTKAPRMKATRTNAARTRTRTKAPTDAATNTHPENGTAPSSR
jgi:transcriptional regulator with XRE-family HTH domain